MRKIITTLFLVTSFSSFGSYVKECNYKGGIMTKSFGEVTFITSDDILAPVVMLEPVDVELERSLSPKTMEKVEAYIPKTNCDVLPYGFAGPEISERIFVKSNYQHDKLESFKVAGPTSAFFQDVAEDAGKTVEELVNTFKD